MIGLVLAVTWLAEVQAVGCAWLLALAILAAVVGYPAFMSWLIYRSAWANRWHYRQGAKVRSAPASISAKAAADYAESSHVTP